MSSRRIAVLGGGRSSEHDVSLASAASVAEGLREAGHRVREITIGQDGVWRDEAPEASVSANGSDGDREEVTLTPGRGIPGVDVVFPVLHGPFGEDGTIQGLLETLDVPYVGAGVMASAVCMDKVIFKELMTQVGMPQVEYRSAAVERFSADPEAVESDVLELGLPLFVKPARLGSSVGISRVGVAGELRDALNDAFEHDPLVIVEAAATGLEVECSVLGNDDPTASEPGEIALTAGRSGWYDYEAKYTPGGMELIVPARISEIARQRVRSLAVEAFKHVDCAGLARADFFVDGDDVLLNELNTMPGFTQTSVYGALFAASGIPYPDLLDRLVELAVERHERAHRYSF
jgi:D-alanine-D-alanine ligase